MKELEIEFQGTGEVSNFTFKQIASSTRGYVYELTDENKNRHYESFERKEQQKSDTLIKGKKVSFEEKVIYPNSNSFGVWAFCYMNIESAMKRFEQISSE